MTQTKRRKAPPAAAASLHIPPGAEYLWRTPARKVSAADMFRPAEHPPIVRGNVPAMAMDELPGLTWASGFDMSAAAVEGQTFLGFPLLSALAQRPEYRRVSEIIARHMTRKWVRLQVASDEDKTEKIQLIEAEMKRLKMQDRFRECAEHDGFFGRGHIFVDLGDDLDDSHSADELKTDLGDGRDKIGRGQLKGLRTVEAIWIYPLGYDAQNPLKADWYKPQIWIVMGRPVHRSRLITIVGREVPDQFKAAYSFGGLSLTQMVKPYVENWLRARQSVSDTMHSFSVSGFKTNMAEALMMQGGGIDQLYRRVELFNNARDNRGCMVIDKDREDFFNITTPLSGLDRLQNQALEQICSVSGIPLVEYCGTTPTGLNASSEGELRVFFDTIHAAQEAVFREPIKQILGYIQLSLFGEIDPDITFDFAPLWDSTPHERAEIAEIEARTDASLVQGGIISVQEARTRIAADPEAPYAGLNPDERLPLPEPAKAELAQRDTQTVLTAFDSGVIDQSQALFELRNIAQRTGRFVIVNEGDIEQARLEPPPAPEPPMMPGMQPGPFGGEPQGEENGLHGVQPPMAHLPPAPGMSNDAGWKEEEHPRSSNGEFGQKENESGRKDDKNKEKSLGPEITGFEGKWHEAVKYLRDLNEDPNNSVGGVAIGVIHHPALSAPIDFPWGEPGTGKKDGYGLSKIIIDHPEVVDDLPSRLESMKVAEMGAGHIVLASDKTRAVVQLKWNDKDRHWLVTAYEPDPNWKYRKRGNVADARDVFPRGHGVTR